MAFADIEQAFPEGTKEEERLEDENDQKRRWKERKRTEWETQWETDLKSNREGESVCEREKVRK